MSVISEFDAVGMATPTTTTRPDNRKGDPRVADPASVEG